MSTHRRLNFRAADLGPVRDKSAFCHFCGKAPPPGEHFSICARCELVVYCGRACQKKHWKIHKSTCLSTVECMQNVRERDRESAANDVARGLPSLEVRGYLLGDFSAAHSLHFRRAWHAAVGYAIKTSPETPFDFEGTCFVVELSYRRDCKGNPALAYRVEDAYFADFAMVTYLLENGSEVADGLTTTSTVLNATLGDHRWGILKIMLTTDNPTQDANEIVISDWVVDPISKSLAGDGEPKSRWLPMLQDITRSGLVHRYTDDTCRERIGTLVKRGSQWTWKPLKPAILNALGLPPDY